MFFIKKLRVSFVFFMASCAILNGEDRVYINSEDLSMDHDAFRIHIGHNIWIETSALQRDKTGLFTFEGNILRNSYEEAYQKTWKCPYCYNFWPVGTPCQNPDCPSKYK